MIVFRFPAEARDFFIFPFANSGGSGPHPASHSFGIGAASPREQKPAVKMSTYLGLVDRFRMAAAVTALPSMSSWLADGQLALFFTVQMQLQNVTATLQACSYTLQ